MMPEAGPKLTAWLALLTLLTSFATSAGPVAGGGTVPRAVRRELDRDQTLLREHLTGLPDTSGVDIDREPTRLVLRIPSQLLFDPDAPSLRADAGSSVPVSAALHLLKQRRRLAAQIAVYSDTIGGMAFNQALSAQRAHNVLALLTRQGIGMERLSEQGGGQQQLVASNDTPETRQQNRRVEIAFQREAGGGAAPAAVRSAPATAP